MIILLTNDDGWNAPGLSALRKALNGCGRIITVAPLHENSGVSQAITLRKPVRMWKTGTDCYKLDGTPTDCVFYTYLGAVDLDEPIGMVVSGINRGPNLGEDVIYSGTVAAAIEGTVHGIPSIAVSLHHQTSPGQYATAAKIARNAVIHVQQHGLPKRTLLNINVPNSSYSALKGIAVTTLGHRDYHDLLIKRTDPFGNPYFWLAGHEMDINDSPHSDYHALNNNRVSVTPITLDMTAKRFQKSLQSWKWRL